MSSAEQPLPDKPDHMSERRSPHGRSPSSTRPVPRVPSALSKSLLLWAILGGIAVWVASDLWSRFEIWAYTPHQFLYENRTLEEVTDLQEVVRPLVDRDQRFDVVATVWSRRPGPHIGARNAEDVLFSDVVFRGLTLGSKGVRSQVNFSVPLSVLSVLPIRTVIVFRADVTVRISSERNAVLENYDLRASFTLVPQSPSLLDGIEDYKSWLPTWWMTTVPMSPSKEIQTRTLINDEDTLVQDAIDSYGVTIPLIEFGPVKSACGAEVEPLSTPAWKPGKTGKFPIESTRGKSATAAHPHVVTRTDLRVVSMTELYNAQWYDTYQQALETNDNLNGCANAYVTQDYDWGSTMMPQDTRNCARSFRMRGNMETKVKVKVSFPDADSRPVSAWAYAPYMDVVPHSWGPMDLVPMPVHREECPGVPKNDTSPSTLNITWNIAFSASPPGQMLLAEVIGESSIALNGDVSTPYKKAKAQSRAQHIHRIHGHKFSERAHTGRSLLIYGTTSLIRTFVIPRLSTNYWKTRTSMAGVSQIGTGIIALGSIASFVKSQYKLWTEEGPRDVTMGLVSLGFSAMAVYITALMLNSVLRLEKTRYFPFVRRRGLSRREKASLRTELQGFVPVVILLAVFLADTAAIVFDEFAITPRVGPVPDDIAPTLQGRILDNIKNFVPESLPLLGQIYQLTLNYRLKTFAGQHKSAVWLALFVFCLERIGNLLWVVGEMPVLQPLTLGDFVYFIPYVVAVVQAVRYPKAKEVEEDEHEE
ncbi:hypothetical protein NMY22_g11250 [Coprinellus aureogranulatus]|nr:hypothetical protein NMY22_g11250 [Coprinellus aureogranulatus]